MIGPWLLLMPRFEPSMSASGEMRSPLSPMARASQLALDNSSPARSLEPPSTRVLLSGLSQILLAARLAGHRMRHDGTGEGSVTPITRSASIPPPAVQTGLAADQRSRPWFVGERNELSVFGRLR